MKITILGCGVFGTALGTAFLNKKPNLWMWSKFEEEVKAIAPKYPDIKFTTNLEEALAKTDLIVIAIPIAFLKETLTTLKKYYQNQDILIASKGIETTSLKFAYELVEEALPNAPLGVLSGGSFAIDMINQNIMGLTLGTTQETLKEKTRLYLEQDFLKIQYTNDIIGVSICGAIKNGMAIGFGLLDGKRLPESSKFLFLTEAIYEINSLITALKGEATTIMSYAGIDDIMMTCTSSKSRNYTLGKMIGEQLPTNKIEEYKTTTTIEGLGTSQAIYNLAQKKNITLPISTTIYKILYENEDPNQLINLLKKES